MTKETHDFYPYALSDRYTRTEGTVFLTGTQALVRIMLIGESLRLTLSRLPALFAL